MARKIKFSFDTNSINNAISEIAAIKSDYMAKCKLYIERLAELGLEAIQDNLSEHVWSGESLSNLRVEDMGDSATGHRYRIVTQSEAILILEFGSGIKYSSTVHPKSAELGVGYGSYPGKGHWNDPDGWWFPTDEPLLIRRYDENGQGWGHSYGMAAQMPFYNGAKEIEKQARNIAKEVFG